MRRQPKGISIQATVLVHEAYLRLRGRVEEGGQFSDDIHFTRTAVRAMRSILVDAARKREARSRRIPRSRVLLEELAGRFEAELGSLIDLDEALARLEEQDGKLAEVAELRLFSGLELPAIAQLLDRPLRTTELHWKLARSCLVRSLR